MKNLLTPVEHISALTQKFKTFNASDPVKGITDLFSSLKKKKICIAFVFLCLLPFLSSSQGFTISGN